MDDLPDILLRLAAERPPDVQEAAARALGNLVAGHKANQTAAAAAGAFPLLLALLAAERSQDVQEAAAAALGSLVAGHGANKTAAAAAAAP